MLPWGVKMPTQNLLVVTVAYVDAEDHVGNGNEVMKLNLGRDY